MLLAASVRLDAVRASEDQLGSSTRAAGVPDSGPKRPNWAEPIPYLRFGRNAKVVNFLGLHGAVRIPDVFLGGVLAHSIRLRPCLMLRRALETAKLLAGVLMLSGIISKRSACPKKKL